jgi:hypothetical protein
MQALEKLNRKYIEFEGVYVGGSHQYLKIDKQVYLFEEDESDGYRSYCNISGTVDAPVGAVFSLDNNPIRLFATFGYDGDFRGLILWSSNKRKVLIGRFGTNYHDDWYPVCSMYIDVPALQKAHSKQLDKTRKMC